MAWYGTGFEQMYDHPECADHHAYREHPRSNHCQRERHADHGGAKAGNELSVHRTANKLNDADGQDQRCDTIALERAVRQHRKQHENAAQQWADESEANMTRHDGVVC